MRLYDGLYFNASFTQCVDIGTPPWRGLHSGCAAPLPGFAKPIERPGTAARDHQPEILAGAGSDLIGQPSAIARGPGSCYP
jgi:hypothetical protein